MFRRILIANRGEIAIRVARTCRELGIRAIGVYSAADRDSIHRRHMDESYAIGPAPAAESYLNIDRVLAVAREAGAEAIHPGYGFLAENPQFARRCADDGIAFIGPSAAAMEKSGEKLGAKAAMTAARLPVTPGSGAVGTATEALVAAGDLGFPVILKAAGGGGGIGMAVVNGPDDMERAFRLSQSTAMASFQDPTLFVEAFHRHPRHIEVQVLADRHGACVHLGERECSIQRRHQKLLEESPSPAVDDETRERLGVMAVRAAQAIGYENAGTIEFLFAGGQFYFNEINARLQVEHTVTEMVTGLDLVAEQIWIAAGERLGAHVKHARIHGWAIECRVNAEDPSANFAPSPGTITRYRAPGGPGVRVDSGIEAGSTVVGFYDPLVAKLIAHGRSRDDAIARLHRAVREFMIEGIATILPLHNRILADEEFRSGNLSTTFLQDRGILHSLATAREDEVAAIAAALAVDPSLAAHLRVPLDLRPAASSRWAQSGRPAGGAHATSHHGRRARP